MSRSRVGIMHLAESTLLGIVQVLLWGGSFFLLAILGNPIMKETGWSHQFIYGALSLAMLISGFVAPLACKQIQNRSKNRIILWPGILMAMGLLCIAMTSSQTLFVLGWSIIGIAMGAGLYDSLFASLGKKYGKNAKKSIVQITLISGFTTTIIWPLLSWMVSSLGWRAALEIYALLLFVLVLPVHYIVFSRRTETSHKPEAIFMTKEPVRRIDDKNSSSIFRMLLINFTLGSFIMTGIYVYLIEILTDKGLSIPQAIAVGAMIGPGQVGVRVIDLFFPADTPIKTAVLSAFAMFLGLSLLAISPSLAFVSIIVYSMGNGIRSILRGTLPLWIWGEENYAGILGRLSRLPLIAQAVTPFIGGWLIQHYTASVFLDILCLLAVLNIVPLLFVAKISYGKLRIFIYTFLPGKRKTMLNNE